MKKMIVTILIIAALMLVLAGCAPGDGTAKADKPAGFFLGIWHGWIAPVTLVIGLFNHDIRIYETANTGWWYDFGFYIAIVGGFGGISLCRRRKTKEVITKKENSDPAE